MATNERPKPRSRRRFIYLLVLAFVVLYVWSSGQRAPLEVADGSTLIIEVSGDYVEADSPTLIARLFGDTGKPFSSLLSLFALAERDDRIKTVVVHIGDLQIGWGKSSELRAAIGRLRSAGRETIAVLDLGSFSANRPYYVATAADKIYAVPGSVIPIVGMAAHYLYFGNMWEKLGIGVEASKIGKYKSAVEMITGTEMSEASREMADALLDSAEDRFANAVQTSRGLTREQLSAIIEDGLVSTYELIEHGLIDGLSHVRHLEATQGDVVRGDDYRNIDPQSVGFDPTVQFALIYGTGNVVAGSAERSASGGPIFSAKRTSDALYAASKDPNIEGIVLRIDSPGGAPGASEYIWQTITDVRAEGTPVVVSVSDLAASAAYYVASAANGIVISPGALTGSIGVFAVRPNFEGLMEKLDVRAETLTRGSHADFGSTLKPMNDDTRERMQQIVRDIYQLFVSRVAVGRNLDAAQVDTLGQGRVWSAEQALEVGLVDELGGLHEAVAWLLRHNELDEETDVALVSYPEPMTLAAELAQLLQSGTFPMSRTSVDVALDALPLPTGLETLRNWAVDLDFSGPLLIPSALIDIQ